MTASAATILMSCPLLMPMARMAPYCFILASTLMPMLLMMLNMEMRAMTVRKPYTKMTMEYHTPRTSPLSMRRSEKVVPSPPRLRISSTSPSVAFPASCTSMMV